MTETKKTFDISSFGLHILAMAFMLCDHLWATVIPGSDWLTVIGRIAFPIFAFMIVEGYFHTKNLKKYVLRLLIGAAISEIPYNLVMGGSAFYPIGQNVLFTFLLGLWLIHLNEKARKSEKLWLRVVAIIGTVILGNLVGLFTFVDYHNGGVLMVLTFYFFRGRKWWCFLGQLAAMCYINQEMLSGFSYELQILGETFWLNRQTFAVLALIPIWLYRGRQGIHNKATKWVFYGFYPVHLLILWIISQAL